MKKIVICGGHLTPALALIEEVMLSDQVGDNGVEVFFFGRKYPTEGSNNLSFEYQVITKKGIKFYEIITGRLQRKFTRYTIPSLLKTPIGFLQSFIYLLQVRPHLIVSFGGYLSVPVIFCGWLLGIDSIIHEQAIVPGLANKINSLLVKKIFLSWKETEKYFDDWKTEVIGNLVRRSIYSSNHSTSDKIELSRVVAFVKKFKNFIFVTGGNQGSHFINRLIFGSSTLLKSYNILHQIGSTDYKGDHQKARQIKRVNYLAVRFIDPDEIGVVMNQTSIVIARSGANTIWELALLAKPAILLPLPIAAGNEQMENAKVLEKAGSAVVLEQDGLRAKMLEENVRMMLLSLSKYKKAAGDFKKTLPKDGALKMSEYVLKLLIPT